MHMGLVLFLPTSSEGKHGPGHEVRQFWGGISTPLFTKLGPVKSKPVSSSENRGHTAINVRHLALNSTQQALWLFPGAG